MFVFLCVCYIYFRTCVSIKQIAVLLHFSKIFVLNHIHVVFIYIFKVSIMKVSVTSRSVEL
jgi:hypothetical protein